MVVVSDRALLAELRQIVRLEIAELAAEEEGLRLQAAELAELRDIAELAAEDGRHKTEATELRARLDIAALTTEVENSTPRRK